MKSKVSDAFLLKRFNKQIMKFPVSCKFCDQSITFIFAEPKNYPMNFNGTRHECWRNEKNKPKVKIIKITPELQVKYSKDKKIS